MLRCIYAIVHIHTGRRYVGSTRDYTHRKVAHLSQLSRGLHHSRFLQRSLNHYGAEEFDWVVLEVVPETINLLEREQAHIDAGAAFNGSIAAGVPRSRGSSLSPEHRAKIGAAQIGRQFSQSTRAKISAALKGKAKDNGQTGRKRTVESRARMSEGQRRRWAASRGEAK